MSSPGEGNETIAVMRSAGEGNETIASSSGIMSSAGEGNETTDGADLLVAAEKGRMGTVIKALEKDPTLILLGDVRGNTVLHIAAKAGDHDTVSKLIQINRKVMTEVNADGDTALHLALKYGHRRAAEHLVCAQRFKNKEKDQAAFIVNKDGVSPWDLALLAGDRHMKELIRPGWRPCFGTIDMEMMLASLAVEDRDEDESKVTFTWSRLHNAARQGSETLVERILQEDPKLVLHVDELQGTVLHVAARAGQPGILQQLVQYIKPRSELHGLILEKDEIGHTALTVAVKYEYKTAALDLIDLAPLAVYQVSYGTLSPLYLAVKSGYHDLVLYMIRKTFSEEATRESLVLHCKEAFLAHVAIKNNNLGMLQLLLGELPSLIDSPNDRGWRPLSYAISKGHLDIVSYLLRNFPHSADKYDRDGSFPIHKAVAAGNLNIVKEIQACCPQTLYAIDKKGRSILHIAVRYAKEDILTYLLMEKGIEKISDLRNKEGKTFTDLAVELKSTCLSPWRIFF